MKRWRLLGSAAAGETEPSIRMPSATGPKNQPVIVGMLDSSDSLANQCGQTGASIRFPEAAPARAMLQTRWSAEAWSQVRVEFKRRLALRSQIRRAG
jgi:hypothetical protein